MQGMNVTHQKYNTHVGIGQTSPTTNPTQSTKHNHNTNVIIDCATTNESVICCVLS